MVQTEKNIFYGLIFDISMNTFRIETIEGINGIINNAQHLADLTNSDEESYKNEIKNLKDALEFLELYDYQIIPVNKRDFELFEELLQKNSDSSNRLDTDLKDEFIKLASNYQHIPLAVETISVLEKIMNFDLKKSSVKHVYSIHEGIPLISIQTYENVDYLIYLINLNDSLEEAEYMLAILDEIELEQATKHGVRGFLNSMVEANQLFYYTFSFKENSCKDGIRILSKEEAIESFPKMEFALDDYDNLFEK